jgi:hypothetical protein
MEEIENVKLLRSQLYNAMGLELDQPEYFGWRPEQRFILISIYELCGKIVRTHQLYDDLSPSGQERARKEHLVHLEVIDKMLDIFQDCEMVGRLIAKKGLLSPIK